MYVVIYIYIKIRTLKNCIRYTTQNPEQLGTRNSESQQLERVINNCNAALPFGKWCCKIVVIGCVTVVLQVEVSKLNNRNIIYYTYL